MQPGTAEIVAPPSVPQDYKPNRHMRRAFLGALRRAKRQAQRKRQRMGKPE